MLQLSSIKSVYFIGVGGIGMSALARYFHSEGKHVGGYDRTETELTRNLQSEGIEVHYVDDVEAVSAVFKEKNSCLVVYTPAIPSAHSELNYFLDKGFEVKKRAEVLGLLTRDMQGVCVAGTHGKTTISSMTAHLLKQSNVGCNAFLGGITLNYSTNYLHDKNSSFVVLEADEFDRSFLHLKPHLALISAMDADHLDIYGDEAKVYEAFNQFIALVNPGGVLLYKAGLDIEEPEGTIELFTYSAKEEGDFHPVNLKLVEGFYQFDLKSPFGIIDNLTMGVPGLVNVENAVGALGLALLAGASKEELQKALPDFAGIKRRFEYRIKSDQLVYIDDYAHHPEEINATLSSVKAMYPNRKITVVFQPHLYTRTRDFAQGFAEALDQCDSVFLLDIYPAREEPIEGVSSLIILEKMRVARAKIVTYAELVGELAEDRPEVILTLGAGDIDKKVPELEGELKQLISN